MEPPRRSRGRPRSPGAESRILAAALEEYVERGWSGFTMDAVARRAGVGKSTVYLRWQDKLVLLIDAVSAHQDTLEDVDTGTLRGDLEHLAATLIHSYTETYGWATLRLSIDVFSAPHGMRIYQEKVNRRRQSLSRGVIARARERGELADDFDGLTLFHSLYGAITMRMIGHGPDWVATDRRVNKMAAELVDFLLREGPDADS
ncbi:TetR/AcrR family transcriptional regulator [Nocardioides ferulae]|uniref:TetR/AcrR family transcriptional regulator n=1 Tax=Nocardioides ferulae TaxID=2340821 RepID=UPI000EB52962|nr:TetR/AcrR family transcriptional regulator [Nocardioides ferulae]